MATAAVPVADSDLLNYSNISVVDRRNFPNQSVIAVNFYGTKITVIVTASASIVDSWINTTLFLGEQFHRLRKLLVALSIDPSANTLQLCVGRRCLIFQLCRAEDVPLSLRSFLCDSACIFTGFLTKWHRSKLLSCKHHLKMHMSPMDLKYTEAGFQNGTVEETIEKSLGCKVELKEEVKTADWSVQNLSNDQVLYACVEVHCAFLMVRNLGVWPQDI